MCNQSDCLRGVVLMNEKYYLNVSATFPLLFVFVLHSTLPDVSLVLVYICLHL